MIRSCVAFEMRRTLARRSTYYVCVLGLGVVLLGLFGNSPDALRDLRSGNHSPGYTTRLYFGMAFTLTLFSAVLGAISVTRDIRTNTASTLYVFSARRTSLYIAKAIVAGLVGAALAVLGLLACWLFSTIALQNNGTSATLGDNGVLLLGGYVAIVVLAGILGVAVGSILRSQLLAVLGLVVWMTMIESSIVSFFPRIGRWLHGGAEAAVVADATLPERLPAVAGAALLVAWTAAAVLAGQKRLQSHEP